jgi:hypothetical protein
MALIMVDGYVVGAVDASEVDVRELEAQGFKVEIR